VHAAHAHGQRHRAQLPGRVQLEASVLKLALRPTANPNRLVVSFIPPGSLCALCVGRPL
jgi:hypothetical protein